MKDLKNIIFEKLIINQNTGKLKSYTDEELRHDWSAVWNSFSLSDKKPYKEKYGVNSNKKEDIQQVISLKLRDNRNKKNKFDDDDIRDFNRLEYKEKEFFDYLDKEPIEFVKILYEHYKEYCQKHNLLRWVGVMNKRDWNYRMSYADKNQLKKYVELRNYLVIEKEL